MNLWGRKCSPCPTPPPSWLLPSDNFLIRVYFLLLSHMSFLSKFQILIPFQIYDLQICFFILQVVFLLMVSFSVQRLFSLRYSHLLIFAFDTFALGVKKKKMVAKTSVRELTSYVFFWEFYGFRTQIVVQFHTFTYSSPSFLVPFIEEAVLSPLYTLVSFVNN